MLSVLRHRVYRRLFTAQVIALIGTGLATVALALLAYDIAGPRAASVLGTALAIKMIAYVTLGPLAGALAGRVPRRTVMVGSDLLRAAVALALPFVGTVWQIYALVFVLQAASALFTPTFQAAIPDVLPDERDYTQALSLSKMAYDIESLLSPALAAALLTVISYSGLFIGTTLGFLASAALVVSAALPRPPDTEQAGMYAAATSGIRLFATTGALRGLLALDLAVAAAGAMVYVNTITIVRDTLHKPASAVGIALACYGAGSITTALLLPRLLRTATDRTVMTTAALALTAPLLALPAVLNLRADLAWVPVLAVWAVLGALSAAVSTPTGRLLNQHVTPTARPAAFAAQFSLSHACWLITYPLAGWLATQAGITTTSLALATLTLLGAIAARLLWPPRPTATTAEILSPSTPGRLPR
ncbi:MFS transporter [Longispora sp. NPDC051575]|uniref:MFS transporter n=1 Tax=Longispora sp. NPDC051575 TaxID=3154943 RepID=UPI00341A87B1